MCTMRSLPDLSKVKKILVAKLRLQGDVLLTAPLFYHLKEALPEVEITALIYEETFPMLSGHHAVAHYLLYDKGWKKLGIWKRLWKELSLFWKIRQEKFDLVINLTEGDRGALAAFVSGAPLRVGFDPGKSGFLGKRKIYTHLVRMCGTPRHTVEKNLDILRALGIFPKSNQSNLTLQIPSSAREKVERFLQKEGISTHNYILIHPFASHRFKCASLALIGRLIQRLHSLGKKVILSCGPSLREQEELEQILKKVPKNAVVAVKGIFSLKEFAALIEQAQSLVCVDSVSLHIASAVRTPVVALFGPTSDQMWGPWQHPKSQVVKYPISCQPCYMSGCGGSGKSQCLLSLSEEKILQALETVCQ